ncbi:MAG: VWA domain-containing protein, partial [Gammaproteobacteria bacterium]|nr:VWA domain-containing protein [Gammaproteobacteria bacterium]
MGKIVIAILVGFAMVTSPKIQANEQKPLLMEGKKTLYQRVLSTPDARVYEQADDSSDSAEIVPFSVLYVYQKQDGWLRVGYNSFGNMVGWVPQKQAIVWNQALTVSFKDPQDTQRVMLFNSKDALKKLVD